MSQPVNLNRFKKQKARADKKTRANENAVKFGRNKAEKNAEKTTAEKSARFVDDHKRDPQ